MATDLDERVTDPGADSRDPARQHYDDVFNKLTSAEHMAKNGGASSEKAVANTANAAEAQAVGSLAGASPAGRLAGLLGFLKGHRKQSVTAGIVTTVIGGGALFGFGTFSGPLQVVHLGEMLSHSFSKNDSDSSNRSGHLFRYARAARKGDIAETRLSGLGSKVYGKTLTQLKDMGVEIETGRTGQPTRTKIDTEKLKEQHPELKGQSTEARKVAIADLLGISPDTISGKGTVFTIDQTKMGLGATRLLTKNTVSLLDDGKIVGAIKARTLTKALDLPSLFHPIQKAKAAATKKYINGTGASDEKKAADAEEAAEEKAVTDTASGDKAAAETADAKSKMTGISSAATKAFTFTGGACLVRSVAGDVVKIDRARVVLPAEAHATRAIGFAGQVRSGQDITAIQTGAFVSTFTDKDGKSIWQSKGLQALSGGKTAGLKDINESQQSAFSSHNTVNKINDVTNIAVGGHPEIACNPGVLLGEAAVTIGIAGFAEVGSLGSATPLVIAGFTAKQAAQLFLMSKLIGVVSNAVLDKTTVDALAADAFKGVSGGNLLAYGSRAASNQAAVASGGIALSNTESRVVAAQAASADKQQFKSESMFARMFDAKDYRSLTGHLADSISPQPAQNVATLVSSVGSIFSSLPHSLANLLPSTSASADDSYNWGFTQYGLPQSMLDDSQLADPYANADKVAKILNSSCPNGTCGGGDQDYVSRVKSCFGDTLALTTDSDTNQQVWDVTPIQTASATDSVDPNSDDYIAGKCDEISSLQWRRIVMFVFDTTTMKAAACYQGDDQSCSDLGASSGDTAAAAGANTGAGAGLRIATFNILGSRHPPAWQGRIGKSADTIVSNKFDVVGLQEVEKGQPQAMLTELQNKAPDTYAMYPAPGIQRTQAPIVYNKQKYDLVAGSSGMMQNVLYYCGAKMLSPYVMLKDKQSGQQFYVLNVHDPALTTYCKSSAPKIRWDDVQEHAKLAKSLSANTPLFFTGDFNSAYSNNSANSKPWQGNDHNLTYCYFNENSGMMDGFDLYHHRAYKCPNPIKNPDGNPKPTGGGIDHIFMTPYVQVTDMKWLASGSNGSDHTTLYMDVTIPGAATPSSASAATTTPSITGLRNFRDASDTSSGQVLKPGVLFRSGQLSGLNAAGSSKLAGVLGANTTIIDLRTAAQRSASPDASVKGTHSVAIPIDGILDQKPMVTDATRRAEVAKALRTAANAPGAVLIHCSAGKDRTGWTVAMIMYISGANNSQVMNEYMKSNEAYPGGVKEAWMNDGLNAAISKYGSVHGYLTKGLGLSNSDISKIKAKFGA